MYKSQDSPTWNAEFRHCPKCGGTLERKKVKDGEPERLVCQSCSFIFFLDPKVVASTICRIDGKIVLLKRAIGPSRGKWVFPGGFVDRGESVEDAAIRETKEEVNLDVKIGELVNVYSTTNLPTVLIVYTGEVVGGSLSARDEALEVRTFTPSEIPWDDLAFPSTVHALRDYVARYCSH